MWLYFNKGNGTIKSSYSNFSIADPASVNKIILKKKNSTIILLERQVAGDWLVNGKYAVNSNALKSLLYTFKNIDIKEPIRKLDEEKVIKELSEQGVLCEIYQNNELTKAYYVGKETYDHSGTHMVMVDSETMQPLAKAFVVYIPGVENNVSANYFVDERAWRDRTVFKYNPADIRSVKMEVPLYPESGYELTMKEGWGYQLSMLSTKQLISNLDTSAVRQYLSYFEQLNFESFETDLTSSQMDMLLKSPPLNIITITDDTGKINKVKFYELWINTLEGDSLDPERMLALLNNGKDLVIVKFFEFGKVMPPAGYFVKK